MTALPLPPALTSPLFLQALYTFLGALADADAASCLKAVADTSTLPRTFSLEEVQYFLDVIREPPSHIDLPDSLLDIANGSGAVSATQPHVQNPSPSRPKSPLALRLCSLSPKPSYLTKLGKAKLKTELERTRVYAWLRASSSDRVLAASAVPRLEDALRTFVSSKLEELNLPCKDVVPCIRTGSAAIPLSSWSWNASWGSTLAPSQPLSRAHEMLQDKAAKVLVLIGPSGMTVNPAAIIPVISHYAERDGLVISIEQAGVPLVVSAREVKEGLELFQTHIMKELAPVDKPYEEQLSACLSSVHSLKVVKLEAAAVPGVELARRMTIAFLCRKAEHLLIWWRWGASFSPDESSDVRRWLGELGEVAQCEYIKNIMFNDTKIGQVKAIGQKRMMCPRVWPSTPTISEHVWQASGRSHAYSTCRSGYAIAAT